MSYINADMNAIVQLAQNLDIYQSELQRLQHLLNEQFNALNRDGHWTDHKSKEFAETQLAPLNDDIQYIFQVLDNDLKPFLSDYYQRLKAYQETW
ncbi:hypothetical protein SNE85_000725 [Vibrio cholerae]|uniref:hypothetical protein n=1 Tax=Vibrio cholerae TaxID=666 RepID=UPI002A0F0157|nr:hypothetical protein [Vibrio cholerae]